MIGIVNQSLLVRSMLIELDDWPQGPAKLAEIIDTGQQVIPVEGVVDARAVYDSITADVVKTPDDGLTEERFGPHGGATPWILSVMK